jgi:hypothetical protein
VPDGEMFFDMAGGDPALAKLVHASLERLRDGAGDDERLQELAREVLAGRVDLREAASSDAYGEALAGQFRRLQEWRDQIGDEEYRRQATEARRQAEQLLDQ